MTTKDELALEEAKGAIADVVIDALRREPSFEETWQMRRALRDVVECVESLTQIIYGRLDELSEAE